MGKHKKTRKEKIIADLRHQLYSFKHQDFPSQNSSIIKPINPQEKQVLSNINSFANTLINSYPYLKHDVLKTLILTMSIVAFQILLLLILKRHIIVLPGIHY